MNYRVTCDGYLDGVETTLESLDSIVAQIEQEQIRRPEFFVEAFEPDASRPAASLHFGHAIAIDDESSTGWCLTYTRHMAPLETVCMCIGDTGESSYGWFIYCGAESQILECCVIGRRDLLEAARAFLGEGTDLSSRFAWVSQIKALNLDSVASQYGVEIST